jgi:hypothetical protein
LLQRRQEIPLSSARRWLRSTVGALCTSAVFVGGAYRTAGAGEVAGSALAAALQTAPELVDSPAQLFLYPQRAVDGPSRIVSFANGAGAGVVLAREGRLAVSALAQGDFSDPPYYSGGTRTLQTALAAGIGALRFGAAFRDERTRSDDVEDEFDLTTNEQSHRDDHSRRSSREFATGVGFGRGRGSVALTAELARLERASDGSEQDRFDDVTYSARVLGQRRWGGAVLVAAPLGSRNLLRLAGAFRDRRADLHLVRDDLMYQSFDYQNPLYGHEWKAGLALEHERLASEKWCLHAFYSDVRDPGAPQASSYVQLEMTREEYAEVGGSYQRPGWWGETQYFGARAYLSKATDETTRFDRDRIARSSRFDERRSHAFSWGASRSFGDLDLVGQVDSNLSFDALFGSLDATLRF